MDFQGQGHRERVVKKHFKPSRAWVQAFIPHARKDKVQASAPLSLASPGQIRVGPSLLPHPLRGAPSGSAGRGCPPGHPFPRVPAWSGPCRPRLAATGHARAGEGRPAALLTWTSSSEGSRGSAAGGGAGGWWCACFRSSPEKSAASRAGLAAPSTGLSCANTGSSCAAGGWGTGPRRALMVSTRVGIDGLGIYGSGARSDRDSHLARAGTGRRTRRGAAAGTPGPAARRSRKRARRSGLLGSATRHRRGPPAATFSRPAPALARSLALSPEPAPATSKLHQQAKRARTCPATTDT